MGIIKRIFKSKLFKYTVLAIFLGCLTGGSITFYKLYSIAKTLPSAEEITEYRMNQPSMVYDVHGRVIAELGTERRYPVHIDEMSIYVRNAVVAVEDSRFYEHSGVDLLGIARAVLRNIKSGKMVEGGSTLTQQLVKNVFLTPEKKLIRKYKEAVIAYRIDNYLTKDEILEFYLNQVNFGRGGYGVQAAAINYFGKNAKDLTLAESALIAGIPKAPSIYSPHINKDKAFQRRNHVLYRMFESGYITEDEYLKTIEEPIVIIDTPPLKLRHAGYFMDYVLQYLKDELGIDKPQNMGLKVYTTLDIDVQTLAEDIIKKNLGEISKRIGYFGPEGNLSEVTTDSLMQVDVDEEDDEVIAIATNIVTKESLMLVPGYLEHLGYKKAVVADVAEQQVKITLGDNVSGVLNLVDNRWAKPYNSNRAQLNDFKTILKKNDIIYVVNKNDPKDNSTYLLTQNSPAESALLAIEPGTGAILAMVGGFAFEKSMFNRSTQAKRQVGSIIKPIIYSVALESGRQPMDKILDAPILSSPNESGMVWRPKNDGDRYYGETTIKEGLTRSRNVVTIKVAESVGLKRILEYIRLFGITSDLPRDMSITIGSGSISLLEMVYAYSVFPNMGTKTEKPYFVSRVEDGDGNIIYGQEPPAHVQVVHPATAQVMTDILVNVVEKGTAFRAKAISRPVGAKTGTSNEGRDAWFIGFTPNLVVGVWSGFDDFSSKLSVGYGSQSSGPAWVDFVKSVSPKLPYAVFPVAEGVVYRKVNNESWEQTDELLGENISFEPYIMEKAEELIEAQAE